MGRSTRGRLRAPLRNLLATREAEKARQERARRDELEAQDAPQPELERRFESRKPSGRSGTNRCERDASGRSSNERSSSPAAATTNH